ncbi:hypothetical protein ACBQ16_11415 [Halopseudomonas bauzanensis]|uniref:hypothetical protein n=1 Tax=Halopseudomonas bauzanensis TaxID=653930 RepID=UPI0035253469
MINLKKALGFREQPMHNTEDARVTGGAEPKRVPSRKGVVWLKKVVKLTAKISLRRLVCWILRDPHQAWDYFFSNVKMILEFIS